MDKLLTLMDEHWKIMEPKPPNLVISVVGGAKNCKLDGRIRETFSTGLQKVQLLSVSGHAVDTFLARLFEEHGEVLQ